VTRGAKVTMTEGPLLRVLLRVALPITITNLVQASFDIVNAFWVGRLGENAIAAITASGPLWRRPAPCSSPRMPGRSGSTCWIMSQRRRC
jgi:hypothetical protein